MNGTIIKYDGSNLEIYNTKLDARNIYENYKYIANNHLSLISFINDYKNPNESQYNENEKEAIMTVIKKDGNRYITKEILKIDKGTRKPKSLEIQDNTQKLLAYILYSEIKT